MAFLFPPQFQSSTGIFQSKKKLIENYDDIDLFPSPGCPSLLYLCFFVLNERTDGKRLQIILSCMKSILIRWEIPLLNWIEFNENEILCMPTITIDLSNLHIWKNISKYQKEFNLLFRPLTSALARWQRNLLSIFLLYIFPSIEWEFNWKTPLAREYPFSNVFLLQIMLHTLWYNSQDENP